MRVRIRVRVRVRVRVRPLGHPLRVATENTDARRVPKDNTDIEKLYGPKI